MRKAAVLLLCATMLGLPGAGRTGVADIRGGGGIVRTWSVGFWETDIGAFDLLELEWVSGQVLSPPYLMNLDVDGTYGVPFAPDGWKVLSGNPQGAIIGCANPADWLGFDVDFLAPEGPTCWLVRAYEGTVLKDAVLISYNGANWRFETLGACCSADGTCAVTTERACGDGFGAWLGAASVCTETGCQQTPACRTSWGSIKTLYR